MYENTNGNNGHCGWDALWGGVIGAGIGFAAGKGGFGNGNGNNCCAPNPCGCGYYAQPCGNGCQTCFQQGVSAGENNAGLNYIGQQVAGNTNRILAVNDNINEKFTQLLQLQINDKNSEISNLKTAGIVKDEACRNQNILNLILQNLQGITTGCAVRAVPACPVCPPA